MLRDLKEMNLSDTLSLFMANKMITENNCWTIAPWIFYFEEYPSAAADYDKSTILPHIVIAPNDSIAFIEGNYNIQYPSLFFDNDRFVPVAETTPFIFSKSYNNQNGGNTIFHKPNFLGQSLEWRGKDFELGSYEIFKGTELLQSGNLPSFEFPYSYTSPGQYIVKTKGKNFRLNNRVTEVILENIFNSENTDANPPVLSSFRVLDQYSNIKNTLPNNQPASILFSCYDYIEPNTTITAPSQVKAYYKFGVHDWTELNVTSHPGLFEASGYGSFYSCDLTSVLEQFESSDFLTFKIEVSDLAENKSIQSWSPLIYVESVNAISNILNTTSHNLQINPQPVKNSSTISFQLNETSKTEIIVCNLNGQVIEKVLEQNLKAGNYNIQWTPKELFNNGTYLVKLITSKGVETIKAIIIH